MAWCSLSNWYIRTCDSPRHLKRRLKVVLNICNVLISNDLH